MNSNKRVKDWLISVAGSFLLSSVTIASLVLAALVASGLIMFAITGDATVFQLGFIPTYIGKAILGGSSVLFGILWFIYWHVMYDIRINGFEAVR